MSAPPTSSPPMKTCGIVGHPDSDESSWRISGSGRTSTAVTGAPASRSARSARSELPHMTNCGVPFMKSTTGSFSITCLIVSFSSLIGPSRRDSHLVNGAVRKRLCERRIDQLVLLEAREPVELRRRDDHLEVVAAAGAVLDAQLVRLWECGSQQRLEALDSHAVMLLTAWLRAGEGSVGVTPLRAQAALPGQERRRVPERTSACSRRDGRSRHRLRGPPSASTPGRTGHACRRTSRSRS